MNAVVGGIFFDVAPPRSVAPTLRMVGFSRAGAQFEVTGTVGTTYAIESSSDMKNWTEVGRTTLVATSQLYVDPSPSSLALSVYRIRPVQ
jgi:hypothetical protein